MVAIIGDIMSLAVQFATLTELFDRLTAHFAVTARPVLMYKVDGQYRGVSYTELRNNVELLAFGFSSLGINRSDRVAIISENRPEWVYTDFALIGLGAIDVPIYPTLTPKQLAYIFNDSSVKAVVVSNTLQLNKVLTIRDEIPSLEYIIVMAETAADESKSIYSFSKILQRGISAQKKRTAFFRQQLSQAMPDDVVTIIYTSGTTGNPKGVVLTHKNFVSDICGAASVLLVDEHDLLLSFLPLCHTFERTAGYYIALAAGCTIAYAESIETVSANMLEVHPTIMATVPRLFERMYTRIMRQLETAPYAQQKFFQWAIRVGKEYAQAQRRGSADMILKAQFALAHKLVFTSFQQRTGGKMRYFVSGGAALAQPIGEFFEAIGLIVLEGYGLTEAAPVVAVNRLDDYKFGTVGKPLPGVEIKIADDGEILAKGANIMLGYYHDTQATEEALSADGWFHTGDIGKFDTEGHLIITDRKKHLFVSSGGKNIAPQPIESLFLQSAYVDQFILIGDGRMYCTALIVPDFVTLKEFARTAGIHYSRDTDLVERDEIKKLYTDEVARLQKDLPTYERVRRFELLPEPLSMENGEITPSLKVKRKVVEQKYAHLIEKMYHMTR
jgi:long-chain acyl-CoA synthetase